MKISLEEPLPSRIQLARGEKLEFVQSVQAPPSKRLKIWFRQSVGFHNPPLQKSSMDTAAAPVNNQTSEYVVASFNSVHCGRGDIFLVPVFPSLWSEKLWYEISVSVA
jgi:hypothetical protein